MRKSKTASSASAEFSSTSVSSSSSVPASSSKSHSITGRSTTATIGSTNTTTTTTTTTGNNSSGGGSGGGCAVGGTRGSRSNDNNVQSTGKQQQQQQQQRSPLNRQFDVVTAPLATFDTVDLSDEEVTTPTATNTNSPSSSTTTNNNNICSKETASTDPTAARTQETNPTHTSVTDTSSCSNSSNVSASSLRTSAANNTNSTTITTTHQNIIPAEISDRKNHVTCTLADLNSITAKVTKKKNNNIYESSGKRDNATRTQTDSITSSAKTTRVEKKSVPELSNQESIRVRSLPDGAKDSDVSVKQSRVTDSNVIPSSSSDDDEGTSHVATALASISPNKCKPDSVSVESIRPTIGEGSTVITAAGTTAVAGATAGSVLSTANVDFANFGSTEDLNTNNIGGSQSIAADGGGLTAPAATGGGAVSKPKEVSTVEKASLLDESSSSDSDLSPTEPGPTGGAYTTLTSGSTPNLIRKISHDATSTIKESSGQPTDFTSPEIIASSSSKRKAYERRLQRLQVKTTPINRPRSTTPLSVVTLDEYTNLSSPEISPNLEKLKIVLPADQFGRPIKSPRSKENAFDFNEDRLFRHTKEAIVLQSDGSIGQSPRRIFIPPTLSPSQSPCKAAAGSPVSKLVLVSRLPAGTSPLVKSAAQSVPQPPPPLLPPPPTATTTTTTISSSSSCSTSSSTSSIPPRKISDKQWEQFEESHSKTPQQQPQATCAIPKRSEQPVALPTFEKKQGLTRTGPPGTSCTVKGQKEQEKKKKKVFTGEDSTKPSFEQHTDLRRNTTSTLNPSHHKVQMNCPEEEEEEEEILKVEIGSSEVGKAYNIELEVPAKEKLDSSHSKSSS